MRKGGPAISVTVDLSDRMRTLLTLGPSRRALQYQGRWETWGDLAARVQALETVFEQAAIAEGSTVGLVTRNQPPHVATLVAAMSSNRCLVPITSIAADPVVVAELGRVDLSVLVADEQDWSRAGLIEQCQQLGILGVVVGPEPTTPLRIIEPPRRRSSELRPGVAVLMPTSGTTGPPKRIEYTYDRLNGALGRVAEYSSATSRSLGGPPAYHAGIVIAPLALAHVAGFWAVMQAVVEGRSIALLDRFEPHEWAAVVHEHQAKL